ncbi:MAG: addiction module protein [Deltaproteobacteria bacterium]|nr:addiction module protein [Deltaproteobacteria bacterium]
MASLHDLLSAALALSVEQRAKLVHELLRSLDEADDEDATAAWTAELQRRFDEVKSGGAQPVSLDEVRAYVARRRAARQAAQ